MFKNALLTNRFGLHQARIDRKLVIHLDGDSIQRYLGIDVGTGTVDAGYLFPEIVGIEHKIHAILDGASRETAIKRINRILNDQHGSEIFFDLYILKDDIENGTAALIIRDVTAECLIRQSLQQRRNDIELLQQDLTEKNNQLTRSREELQRLNSDLEKVVDRRTRELQASIDLSKRLFSQTVNALMFAMEKRDPYTVGHQQRVGILAAAIGRELGLSDNVIEGISVASRLHDIGKIYVPSEFLTKPLRLTEAEFSVVQTHSRVGYEILRDIEFPWPVATITLQHHEKCDGSGYPDGLTADKILLESKIITVADVVEAMATFRPYRYSSSIESALDEIEKNSGKLYDSQVVGTCLNLFRKKGFRWDD